MILFQRFQAQDHRFHARARLLVAREQLRTLGRKLFLAVAQAAVFFLQRATQLKQPVDPVAD